LTNYGLKFSLAPALVEFMFCILKLQFFQYKWIKTDMYVLVFREECREGEDW